MPLKRDGAFVRPGLIDVTGVETPDEELFGPVLQVCRVKDFDHALDIANATRFGLAGGLISDDPALWARVKNEMRAGVLNWNRPTTGASGAMPFGGPGLSGSLRPSAYYAADYVAYPGRDAARGEGRADRRAGPADMSAVEVNFDGLVGPTHNYAGLSEGNLASARNRDTVARPREAALQGLAKMPAPARARLGAGRAAAAGAAEHQLGCARSASPARIATCGSAPGGAEPLIARARSRRLGDVGGERGDDFAERRLRRRPPARDRRQSADHAAPRRSKPSKPSARSAHAVAGRGALCRARRAARRTTRCRDEGAANHMRMCAQARRAGR